MSAMNKCFNKRALAIATAAAVLGLAAVSAEAGLRWRVTDTNTATTITVCDGNVGVGCLAGGDFDGLVNEIITVNTTAVNLLLLAAGSKFSFDSAGANTNFLIPNNIAIINSSSQVEVGNGALDTLVIEATRDGWLKPATNPRTLTNGPAGTLTGTAGAITSAGFNDPNNNLFGEAGFATAPSVFVAGVGPNCGPILGTISTCSDLKTLGGIVEGNPYSLTNRQSIASPNGDGPATYLITDASTKFGPLAVPEPASLLLLGTGLAALGFGRRRKSS